jgi:hypothetical protein
MVPVEMEYCHWVQHYAATGGIPEGLSILPPGAIESCHLIRRGLDCQIPMSADFSVAPPFIAFTVVGISPCSVRKMIGGPSLFADEFAIPSQSCLEVKNEGYVPQP